MSKASGKSARPLYKRVGYLILRVVFRLWLLVMFRTRIRGQKNVPKQGGALICANHQSHLDPVLIGSCCERRLNFLARKTLFKSKLFGFMIDYLDAIPLDREGIGVTGIKETIKRIRAGEMVLIFPEGTRSRDGKLGPMLPGVCSIARRCKAPLIPVGFDGAYQAWPRSQSLPEFGHIAISFGEPIQPEEYAQFDDNQMVEILGERIAAEFEVAQKMRR